MKHLTFIEGMLVGAFITMLIGFASATMEMQVNKSKSVTPIVVKCPDNTKQIVIPQAEKMGL